MRHIPHSAFGTRGSAVAPLSHSAFTLVEVLIALVILAVGAVALLQLQLVSIRSADRAFRQSQALLLAGRMMSETLSAGYPAVGSSVGTAEQEGAGGQLQWSVAVADVTSADLQGAVVPGLRSVTVAVSWLDERDQPVQLVNYVAQRASRAQSPN